MGMFDSVVATCPKCMGLVEFQSKAGKCRLKDYTPHAVPPEIARELDGEVEECPICGAHVKLSLRKKINKVAMDVCLASEADDEF